MEYLLTSLFYILLGIWTAIELYRTDYLRLTFSDGLLIGAAYYLMAPMFVILVNGSLEMVDYLTVSPYVIERDGLTTFNLYLGWFCVLSFHLVQRIFRTRPLVRAVQVLPDKTIMGLLVGVYVFFALLTFYMSGKTGGGHWADQAAAELSQSTAFIFIGGVTNVYRAVVFGFIIYLHSRGLISTKKALAYGMCLAVFDTAVSFSRITFVYFIFVILVVNRRRLFWLMLAAIPGAPIVAYISGAWAMFRGMALSGGFNFDSVRNAFEAASNAAGAAQSSLASQLNNIFEASNIMMFNYIVQNVPTPQFPVFWGGTFLLRPLAIFIPSTIWADKPPAFNVTLALHSVSVGGLALNSTLFGEAYADFYYLWPLALLGMLTLLQFLFGRLARMRPFYGFFACFVATGLWRFDMTYAFVSLFAICIFELGLRSLFMFIRRPNRPSPPRVSAGPAH